MDSECLFTGCALVETGLRQVVLPEFMTKNSRCLENGVPLLIGMHEVQPCLILFPAPHLKAIHDDLDRRRLQQREGDWLGAHSKRLHRSFGLIQEGTDARGRLTIPSLLRRLGRVEDRALFIGTGPMVEIWSIAAATEADDPLLREMVSSF